MVCDVSQISLGFYMPSVVLHGVYETNRDAHSKDFRPLFDQFSLQFLFNFTANLTFFAVKMKEN